ncbi:TLR13 protein, partial [Dromas ardeola]|nr:TLR13 protein [Dromas ardeola]
NCIQLPRDPGLFRCVQRFLETVASAVGDLPPATTSLNISHNLLTRLPPAAFARLPRLRTLDLAYNHLASMAPGAFSGLGALATLDLAHNRLAALAEGTFAGLGNLSSLRLDHNPLASLAPGVLLPLANLTRLSLRGGHLPALGPVAVAIGHLPRLQLLDLCGNNLSALGPGPPLPRSLATLRLCNNSLWGLAGGTPGLLSAVRVLDLSYNNISEPAAFSRLRLRNLSRLLVAGNPLDALRLLEASDLRPRSLDVSGLRLELAQVGQFCRRLGVTRLRRLELRRNGLRELPEGSLAACPPAATLDLSGNRLWRLGCLGALLGPGQRGELREVVVEHNLLQRLPFCRQPQVLPRLLNVSLRFNRILTVGPGAFAEAPALRLLRLDVNGLARLDRRGLQGLRGLRELRLDNNRLADLFPGSFAHLGRLLTLNLRNNRVSVLFPGTFAGLGRLQTLDLGGNNLRHLAADALRELGGLRRLYLDRNRLQEVSAKTFVPVQASLEVLDLRANALRYVSHRLRQQPPFRHLRRLYDLKLQAQRPYGLRIIPQRFFQGLTSLQSLFLAQNSLLAISADAFDDLGQLRYLTLADSSGGMGDLPAGVFKNLTLLRSLDLENMGLRRLAPQVFGNLSQLERLQLAKNELRSLDWRLEGWLPALRYLDLRKCPLSCSCANAWLPAWLERSRVQVVYLYNYTCGDGGAGATMMVVVTMVMMMAVIMATVVAMVVTAMVIVAVMVVVVVPMVVTMVVVVMVVVMLVLVLMMVVMHRRYAYDSFVSYNSADEGWVLGELVPELERCSLRLCLHHRDFSPGRAIVDNIVDAIYNSRKTVCVVSRGYLRSEWCSLEIQLASYRLFDELRDVLVLVFLEAIPEAELAVYHRMRRVLLKRTYLRWPQQPQAQRLFWAKLARALRSGYEEGEEQEEGEREEEEEEEEGCGEP